MPAVNQVKDISDKFEESFNFLQTRKERQVKQLVLLNNLQRGDQNIAATLLITLFNRIMSSLYDDKIQIGFVPIEEIDQKRINSLNLLAENDYREMDKAKLDYDWVWDTLFFGRGYMETLRFNKKRKIMEPHVINPLVFGFDPFFENPQEWRYYWKWVTKSKWQINKLIKDGTLTGIKDASELPSGVDSYLWNYKSRRDEAKKAIQPPPQSTNDIYQILEYFGFDEDGKKTVFWLDKELSKVIMQETLDLRDAEDGKDSLWPVVTKEAFREPHSSLMFSIADILEDKHRAKSVLLNLAFIAAKDVANPLYGYNPDKVKDITQFFSRQLNQHIPMEDETAAWPLSRQDPMPAGLINFISMLQTEANDPVGTGMVGQPRQDAGSDTATEAAITQQMNDLAQSLQSKVMQFGEADFWSHWYQRYKRNSKEGDTKMATIIGVKGTTFEKVDMGGFHTKNPPGVLVYSAKEAAYKELVMRRDLMQLYPQLTVTLGPEGMRNFNKHVFFPKFLDDPSLIDIMLPKTIDEMKAEAENEQLKDGQLVRAAETDNHETHIYTHHMTVPKTWALWFHLHEHEEMLAEQKSDMMAQQQLAGEAPVAGQLPGQMQVTNEEKSPVEAATPLKQGISRSIKQNNGLRTTTSS